MGDPLNLAQCIRQSSARIMEQAGHVSVECVADFVRNNLLRHVKTEIRWDSGDFHYCQDAQFDGPLTCQYVMILDGLNFCFWPTPGMEYEHLARGLKQALEQDPTILDAHRLATIDSKVVASWFAPFHPNQLVERTLRVQEIGLVLLRYFDGLAFNLVNQANHSAVELLRLLQMYFTGFQDHALYKGEQVYFYKRAQILIGDVWAAYGCRKTGFASFHDMDQLTMFADYRVPQLLHSRGVLAYSKTLEDKVLQKETIASGSELECEIRAATIHAVERIKQELETEHNIRLLVIQIDWILWQLGEEKKEVLHPHHRVHSIYY